MTGFPSQDDAVVDPVWTVYFDGRPMEVSRAACGYVLEEWLAGGKDFFKQVATPQSLANIRAATRAVRTRGVTLHNVECEIRGKEPGRRYHFLINYQPVFNGANEIVGVRGDARDVTELMQFERALGRGAALLVSLRQHVGRVRVRQRQHLLAITTGIGYRRTRRTSSWIGRQHRMRVS